MQVLIQGRNIFSILNIEWCEHRMVCREKGKQIGRSKYAGLEYGIASCKAGSRHFF